MKEKLLRKWCNVFSINLANVCSNDGWIPGNCPLAPWTHKSGTDNNASFVLHASDTSRSYYTCFSCGHKGSFIDLIIMLGRLRKQNYSEHYIKLEKSEVGRLDNVVEFPGWESTETTCEHKNIATLNGYEKVLFHPYLSERNVSWKVANLLNLRYDYYDRRIVFPVYDKLGILRGLTGRSVLPNLTNKSDILKVKDYQGLQKRLYFLGESITFRHPYFKTKPVVVVEGLFDLARVYELGEYACLAILGTKITEEKLQTLKDCDRPIIFMPDNDEAGRNVIYGIRDPDTFKRKPETGILSQLKGFNPLYVAPYKKGYKDVADMSLDILYKSLKKARFVSF